MIAKLLNPSTNQHWESVIEKVEFALNNTIHRSVKDHPSILLFGIQQRGQVVDDLKENVLDFETNEIRDLNKVRTKAEKEQEKVQNYNENYVNKKRKAPTKFKENVYVVVTNFDSTAGVSRKLIPKYKGPYKITKVLRNDRYLLEDVDGFQQSRKPYQGVWAIGNLKPWFNVS